MYVFAALPCLHLKGYEDNKRTNTLCLQFHENSISFPFKTGRIEHVCLSVFDNSDQSVNPLLAKGTPRRRVMSLVTSHLLPVA